MSSFGYLLPSSQARHRNGRSQHPHGHGSGRCPAWAVDGSRQRFSAPWLACIAVSKDDVRLRSREKMLSENQFLSQDDLPSSAQLRLRTSSRHQWAGRHLGSHHPQPEKRGGRGESEGGHSRVSSGSHRLRMHLPGEKRQWCLKAKRILQGRVGGNGGCGRISAYAP